MASQSRLQEKPKPAKAPEPMVRERYSYVPGLTLPPNPGIDYSRVLSGPGQRAATSVGGLAAAVLSYFFIYPLVSQLVLRVGYIARGRPGVFLQYTADALAFEYPEGLLASHLGLGSLIAVTAVLMKYAHQRDAHWLASVQPGMRWRYLILCFGVAMIVMNGFYWATTGRVEFTWNPQPNAWVWLILILLTTPLQAAGEEYFFRGYLIQVVGSLVPWKWVSIGVSSLLFALAHGINLDLQNIPLFLDRFAFGALMGVLIVFTGGIEAAIAAHVANNISAFSYAALDGGVAAVRGITEVTWDVAVWNLAGYALTGVLCWVLGNKLRVAKYTPAL